MNNVHAGTLGRWRQSPHLVSSQHKSKSAQKAFQTYKYDLIKSNENVPALAWASTSRSAHTSYLIMIVAKLDISPSLAFRSHSVRPSECEQRLCYDFLPPGYFAAADDRKNVSKALLYFFITFSGSCMCLHCTHPSLVDTFHLLVGFVRLNIRSIRPGNHYHLRDVRSVVWISKNLVKLFQFLVAARIKLKNSYWHNCIHIPNWKNKKIKEKWK